ncbi:putative membrane protein [Chromohalobacter marismortui]|uniref:Putative membrane protein n=1 Tax=Chromohalobacter marismortui TaxID=42055 RepID=A0A4R7NVB9_9GAMM|nr:MULTISPECIES: pilus assembly protein TadG-related protein [Chromohalobacter]MCI0510310.1 pilus assembly protein TadG-related protein [Chromohalobacter sp.]MCI0594005.1 pilus assembly protein TadG-related protein [Chromohalobacter sp.]TDU25115.1 putative membrane protein [Chromohalobacter marismortui]
MLRHASPAPCRTQRGAIGLLAMGVLGLVILCLVLALDVGRLYYEQAKLQKQADTAAMEAAAQGPMCGGEKNANSSATFGSMVWNESGEEWKFDNDPGNGLRDAAEVVLEKDVTTSLVVNIKRVLDIDEGKTTLTARAVARRLPVAGISVGNSLLSLDSADSPLLGPLVSGLVGYDAAVSILNSSQVASITLGDLFQRSPASVFEEFQEDEYPPSALIRMIGGAAGVSDIVSGSASQGKLINVLDILDLSALQRDRESLLNLSIPLEPLLNAVVTAASIDAPLVQKDVDSGAVGLNLESKLMPDAFDLGLVIQSPARIAFGPPGKAPQGAGTMGYRTQVTSAQIKVWLNSELDISPLASFDLGLVAEVGAARAWLDTIECQGVNRYTVRVGSRPSVIKLALGHIETLANGVPNDVSPISVNLIGSSEVSLASIDIAASTNGGESSMQEAQYSVFQGNYPATTNVVPSSSILQDDINSLLSGLDVDVDILQSNQCPIFLCDVLDGVGDLVSELTEFTVGTVAELVRNIVDPIVRSLLEQVLDPLLAALGVSVNQYEVSVYSPQAKVELVK